MKRTYFRRWVSVQLYESDLLICITDRIPFERRRLINVFGPCPFDDDHYDALATRAHGKKKFAIFLSREAKPSQIAHEVWHVTNYILEYVDIPRDDSGASHEAGAYLCGWITQQVHDAIAASNK